VRGHFFAVAHQKNVANDHGMIPRLPSIALKRTPISVN
jgi:hypothetical protein